ncbi:MAG: glycosyltransferase family 2 protein [Candidatus Hodarchaeota archaeon]
MPTRNRREFVPLAIRYFLLQDYPHKELVVVDDGEDKVCELLPKTETIKYLSFDRPLTIGKKRNIAIEASRGDVIIHWDDDDWFAANRISLQVHSLPVHEHCVSGLDKVIFFDTIRQRAWLYECQETSRPWLAGGTLCYKREVWKEKEFDDLTYGEDTQFLWSRKEFRVLPLTDFTFYVATIHSKNTVIKDCCSDHWISFPVEECQKIMGTDYRLYVNGKLEASNERYHWDIRAQ